MTRFVGYDIMATQCCGAQYRTKRYASMNFMASAYWTGGYREQSLMPNDHGLRKCRCGAYYMLGELVPLASVETSDLPDTMLVGPEELPQAVAEAKTEEAELAARLDYWQHLNHPYRERYRAHREAEEAVWKLAWEKEHTDLLSPAYRQKRSTRQPSYKRPSNVRITYPPFETTEEQRVNMEALLKLLADGVNQRHYLTEVAELNRELGNFEEAKKALSALESEESSSAARLIAYLVEQRDAALVRYTL